MSFKEFSILSSGGHFVQQSGTFLATLVEGNPRNISVKLFEIGPLAKEMSFKGFFLFFSSGGHFVQQSGKYLAILVQGLPWDISEKLF